jgi:hypothetical protein
LGIKALNQFNISAHRPLFEVACHSLAHSKFAASLISPAPLYFGQVG